VSDVGVVSVCEDPSIRDSKSHEISRPIYRPANRTFSLVGGCRRKEFSKLRGWLKRLVIVESVPVL
jgi:hypothetical protein